ncbi:MAG TPA: NUDIX domain-containing protein [Acidimicrobiia bacterium]|nr:NUDIX domain-containing protein [Acidimicrobiia bacterium]
MSGPRPASTVLLVRDGRDGIEVVLGRRPPGGPFGNLWVFPGGAVDPEDVAAATDPETVWRLAALRETWEEIGLALTDPDGAPVPSGTGSVHERLRTAGARFATERLVYLSNWVTPRMVSKRFDTRFYLAAADGELRSTEELADPIWVPAEAALHQNRRGSLPMIFPTVSHLRYLVRFDRVTSLVEEAVALDVIPSIEPRPSERGDPAELVVDNDPRFGT